jgi:hypothetical protein
MYSRWQRFALASQVSLFIYFQACMWLPLYAWNDIWSFPPQHSLQSSIGPLAIGFGTGLLIAATIWRIHWLMWIGVLGHFLWFITQASTIWPPYIVGASEAYASTYHRVWGQTTKLLPSWGNHLAPDGMHILIQGLLVAVLSSTFVLSMVREGRSRSAEELQKSRTEFQRS